MFNAEELKSFAKELRKVGQRYGISESVLDAAVGKITFKDMNDDEYLHMVTDIVLELMDNGVASDLTETIVAEAIHNRERVVVQTVEPKQVVYGPPPTQEVHTVEKMPQLVYGPPPTPEAVQVFANPPKVYGPMPTTEGGMSRR